jgi:hypothetical protein
MALVAAFAVVIVCILLLCWEEMLRMTTRGRPSAMGARTPAVQQPTESDLMDRIRAPGLARMRAEVTAMRHADPDEGQGWRWP